MLDKELCNVILPHKLQQQRYIQLRGNGEHRLRNVVLLLPPYNRSWRGDHRCKGGKRKHRGIVPVTNSKAFAMVVLKNSMFGFHVFMNFQIYCKIKTH